MTQTKHSRCTCGHAMTAHGTRTWHGTGRGACTTTVKPSAETAALATRCGCRQYTPATLAHSATERDRV